MTTSERTPEDLLAQEAVRHLRARVEAADPTALDLLLREARTHYGWSDRPVPESTLRAVYDLARWGPTSMNQQPARYVFVRSADAKERLIPAMMQSNREKVAAAPVTAIIAYDEAFYEKLPQVYPSSPRVRDYFAREPAKAAESALRNGTLQAAYFIIAARAMGLDTGPMSGFDQAQVDELFLVGTGWRSNFLCSLGFGDETKLRCRLPRLDFGEVVRIV